MSRSATQPMHDWVARVLGVTPGAPAAAAAAGGHAAGAIDWAAITESWRTASDTADGQIASLQAALRASDDEVLESIADGGLNGVTGNFKVPLMAALREAGSGDPAILAKTAPKLLGIVRDFRAHLEGSEEVEVCDDNPFGVAVSLRATLGGALADIEAALQGVA